MRLFIYPFTRQQLIELYVIDHELPCFFDQHELWGVIPNSIYSPINPLQRLDSRDIAININAICFDDLCEQILTSSDIFVRTTGDKTAASDAFADKITDFLIQNACTVIDSSMAVEKLGIRSNQSENLVRSEFMYTRTHLYQPSIPVIGVGSVYPHWHTAEIVSSIKKVLGNEIRISSIYSSLSHNALGLNCIALEDLYELPFDRKVAYINWYINRIIDTEKPQVILVEVPGGVMKFNNYSLNGSGEYPYLFSQAIGFDYYICSALLNGLEQSTMNSLRKYLEARYGYRHITFHISNILLSSQKRLEEITMAYVLVDQHYVDQEVARMELQADKGGQYFNMLHEAEIRRWYSNV